MATSRASKWFSNKSLRLSFHPRRRSKPSSTLTSAGSSPPSTHTPNKRTKRLPEAEEMKEVFRYFDGDNDGKISALELRLYFGSIGEYMSHEDAQGVINDLDSDGDHMLDYQDFLKLMQKEGCDDNDDDLKKAFEMFELEKGCITPKGLQKMFNRLGDSKSYDECVSMIQVYDIDGNGVLDFHEFQQMMA